MAQLDLVRRLLDSGADLTELTQRRAEQLVQSLVDAGELQREQANKAVNDLMDRSRKNRERLTVMIEREVQASIRRMGLATQADVERLERKLTKLQQSQDGPGAGTRAPARKKAAAKKKPAGRSGTASSGKS
jgi:polyhydroxyalkanoate synthesis regulator phasin